MKRIDTHLHLLPLVVNSVLHGGTDTILINIIFTLGQLSLLGLLGLLWRGCSDGYHNEPEDENVSPSSSTSSAQDVFGALIQVRMLLLAATKPTRTYVLAMVMEERRG